MVVRVAHLLKVGTRWTRRYKRKTLFIFLHVLTATAPDRPLYKTLCLFENDIKTHNVIGQRDQQWHTLVHWISIWNSIWNPKLDWHWAWCPAKGWHDWTTVHDTWLSPHAHVCSRPTKSAAGTGFILHAQRHTAERIYELSSHFI